MGARSIRAFSGPLPFAFRLVFGYITAMTQSVQPILHENLPLLEVADPVLLEILMADPQARKFILAPLSERAAIVAPGAFDALLARLRKLGHTPKIVET